MGRFSEFASQPDPLVEAPEEAGRFAQFAAEPPPAVAPTQGRFAKFAQPVEAAPQSQGRFAEFANTQGGAEVPLSEKVKASPIMAGLDLVGGLAQVPKMAMEMQKLNPLFRVAAKYHPLTTQAETFQDIASDWGTARADEADVIRQSVPQQTAPIVSQIGRAPV